MNTAVEICKDYLKEQYKYLLNADLDLFDSSKVPYTTPLWQWIGTDLNPWTENDEPIDKGGLIIDPEIGICLYLIPFVPQRTDIPSQILRALQIRSKLLPEIHHNDTNKSILDKNGSWRIAIHWLISKQTHFEKLWLPIITKLRKETAHFEEIPVDVVVNDNNDWKSSLQMHGLPRLLFNTRAIFRKQGFNDIDQWLSADMVVSEKLKNLPSAFEKPKLIALAKEVVQIIGGYTSDNDDEDHLVSSRIDSSPKSIKKCRVQNFRNIANLELNFGEAPVSSLILHGPNGTGKSSLFEALSFGLFQSSYRYSQYLNDKDISSRNRPQQYMESYLRPINKKTDDVPEIWINENLVTLDSVNGQLEADRTNIEMGGTLLSQETSRDFLYMTSEELGALVLKDYSVLANKVEMYVRNNHEKSDKDRKDLLRNLELSASITRIQTALERIAKKIIESDLPSLSRPLVEWLELASNIEYTDYKKAEELSKKWQAWGSEAKKSRLFKEISAQVVQEDKASVLETWLSQYNEVLSETRSWTTQLASDELKSLQKETEEIINQVESWGRWLASQEDKKTSASNQEIENFKKQIVKLQKQQQQIVSIGKKLKARLDHFAQIGKFLREDWNEHHPNECPTCGTDLKTKGGILAVVNDLEEIVQADREKELERFNEVTNVIKGHENKLVALGQQKCPVSAEDQSKLIESLQWLIPKNQMFSEWIRDNKRRTELIEQVRILKLFPTIPSDIDPSIEAERVAKKITEEFERARIVFEEPDNWKAIKKSLDKKLGSIVEEHLPKTLGVLWQELAMNLTSAPWLLPGRVNFHIKTLRGQRHLKIKIGKDAKAPFARYILNQAEVHIMGLAWFFARHMTYGRFRHSCLVMDDPAQEMDQVTPSPL